MFCRRAGMSSIALKSSSSFHTPDASGDLPFFASTAVSCTKVVQLEARYMIVCNGITCQTNLAFNNEICTETAKMQ